MYVVFEGIDTCGKTTQIELLKSVFPKAIFTKEPGGTRIGEKIREVVLENENLDSRAEFFLFLADRIQHLKEVIIPNYLDHMVIADRSFISGIAYAQKSMTQALELNFSMMQNIFPDRIILLQIDRETLCKRLSDKKHDVIEKRGVDYLLEIQNNLLEISKKLGRKILVLNANQEKNLLHQEIVQFLQCDA